MSQFGPFFGTVRHDAPPVRLQGWLSKVEQLARREFYACKRTPWEAFVAWLKAAP